MRFWDVDYLTRFFWRKIYWTIVFQQDSFDEIVLTKFYLQDFFGQDILDAFKIWALFKSSFRIQVASLILLHFYWCPTTKFYNWNQKSHKINALCSKLQWTGQYCSTLGIIQTLDSQPTNNPAHWGGFLLIFIGAQQPMSKSTKVQKYTFVLELSFSNSQKKNYQNFRDWPWVNRMNWCECHWCGSTYMVVRLSY